MSHSAFFPRSERVDRLRFLVEIRGSQLQYLPSVDTNQSQLEASHLIGIGMATVIGQHGRTGRQYKKIRNNRQKDIALTVQLSSH